MALIKPFECVRPNEKDAARVAALPYDVYNSEEAREIVAAEPKSFLQIDRAETLLPKGTNPYSEAVYKTASETLNRMIDEGSFLQDKEPCYYLYALTMNGRTQTGLVGCASIDDYCNNVILKHENTLEAKEQDRIRHIDACSAQTGPIFLAYRANTSCSSAEAPRCSSSRRNSVLMASMFRAYFCFAPPSPRCSSVM